MKISKEKKPLDKLYRRRNRYDLQPDYQRDEVWDKNRKQRLLDTILKKWDIPKVYINILGKDDFEVVDGQQRLNAIYEFYGNDLELSSEFTKDYGDLVYNDLPDKIKDIFDDFKIDIVLIEEAEDQELKELFSRLQLGKPLNSGEKLNAVHGKCRDFAKELSEHNFIKNKISLKNTRYSYLSIAGQLCILGIKGIESHKFKDIEDFFIANVNFNKNSTKGKRVIKILNLMDKMLEVNPGIFRNRASITTFFTLINDLIEEGFKFDTLKNRNKI